MAGRLVTVGPSPNPTGTCVPGVGARGPGQLGGEGAEQVEEGPGQDDDIVDVQIGLDDYRRQPNALGTGLGWGWETGRSERSELARSPQELSVALEGHGATETLPGLLTGPRTLYSLFF